MTPKATMRTGRSESSGTTFAVADAGLAARATRIVALSDRVGSWRSLALAAGRLLDGVAERIVPLTTICRNALCAKGH